MKRITRRRWIKNTCLASTASLAPPLLAEEKKQSGCGLGIGSYGLQSMKLEDALRLIADTGFTACDVTAYPDSTGDPEKLDKTRRGEINKLISDQGLRLSAVVADLRPSPDDADHRRKSSELKRLCELTREISPSGSSVVQATLGGKTWDKEKGLFRDRLADWMQIAADFKTVFTIKPHRGSAMSRPADAIWLFEQLGKSRWLQMTYDYSHYSFRTPPMSIEDTVKTALPWTHNVAVKDTILVDGKTRFALPGDGGNWDNADIVRAFHSGGFRGDFVCEVSAQIWKGDPKYEAEAATIKCFRNMKSAFERAGVPII